MVSTREFQITNNAGDVLFRTSRPRFARAWYQANKSNLPPGRYHLKRVIRNHNFTKPATGQDRQAGWKDQYFQNN